MTVAKKDRNLCKREVEEIRRALNEVGAHGLLFELGKQVSAGLPEGTFRDMFTGSIAAALCTLDLYEEINDLTWETVEEGKAPSKG
jgi:hypothetical protein